MNVHRRILFLLVAALVISACSTPVPAPTPTTAEIALAPFTDYHFAIQGLRPEGWTEIQPGTFVEEASPPYTPQLLYAAFPGLTTDWADVYFARELGLEGLPETRDTYESPSLNWELTTFEVDHPEMGKVMVDGALAETESALYMVAVLADRDEYEPLHEAVLLPVVDALTPLDFSQRDKLTKTQLTAGAPLEGTPVNNAYLSPIGAFAPALHSLEGTLSVPEFQMRSSERDTDSVSVAQRYFPGFSAGFFTHDDYLVPVERDILTPTDGESYWSIILSPGKVWSEPGDEGMSRASFPFLLVAAQSNEAHNGVASFLYDNTGVSSLYVQVVQETAAWNRTDFWGQAPIEYTSGPVPNLSDLKSAFAEELSLQTPTRPWSDLDQKHDAGLLSTFNIPHHPWDVSASGLIVDDTICMQPCLTRYGEFPYCEYMRHGVFSVTKSMGAAVAMLRLAEKYGEEVFDLRIADYVEITADHDGWEEVTFADALNMATGIGDNPELEAITAEEDQPRFSRFLEARSAQEKLDVCFSYRNYPWDPGEVARYNSINTFVLSVAMDSFLKSKEGPEADIWDMVVDEVYKPIGIHHAPIMRTHESDGSKGVPIFGYGLYPTVDDIAKVTRLLHNGGRHRGQQFLHAGKLAEALYQTGEVGLPTGESNEYGDATYHMSFWSMPYRTTDGVFYLVPYMSGFGGNHVALMPNGMTAFRFADAHIYGIESMVTVADAIRPF